MALIKFVRNYRDDSTDHGFQFEFYCDVCRNGYQSSFEASQSRTLSDALDVAGGIFGGVFSTASNVGQRVHSAAWEKAHDQAFAKAIVEVKGCFNQCPRCGKWVCNEICWNEERSLCVECAPKMAGEIAAAQSEATIEQLRNKLREKNLVQELDLDTKAVTTCPRCSAETKGGKFCPECGAPLAVKTICPRCGTDAGAARFCPECGMKME
jgi:hypothetical protein